MKNSLLLAMLVCWASGASALTFQSGTFSALRAVDGAPDALPPVPPAASAPASTIFPKYLDCTGMGGSLRFYLRLESFKTWDSLPEAGHTPVSVWDGRAIKDETAAGLDDYRGATVTRGVYTYSLWSCDTTDYTFTFDMKSLARQTSTENERWVKGHAHIEARGIALGENDLACVARY